MKVAQQNAGTSSCHRQALVDSIARGNEIAEQELRLLLRMESQQLPRQRCPRDR